MSSFNLGFFISQFSRKKALKCWSLTPMIMGIVWGWTHNCVSLNVTKLRYEDLQLD